MRTNMKTIEGLGSMSRRFLMAGKRLIGCQQRTGFSFWRHICGWKGRCDGEKGIGYGIMRQRRGIGMLGGDRLKTYDHSLILAKNREDVTVGWSLIYTVYSSHSLLLSLAVVAHLPTPQHDPRPHRQMTFDTTRRVAKFLISFIILIAFRPRDLRTPYFDISCISS